MQDTVTEKKPTDVEANDTKGAKPSPSSGDRRVKALPVMAVSAMMVTVAAIIYFGRAQARRPESTPAASADPHTFAPPRPVSDVDHYVPGSPPAVAERFLRAWMRGRYEDARDLATGEMRARAAREVAEVAGFNPTQQEEYRRTRAYVDATHYDLEHIEIRDLPPTADGRPRKEVRGQGHAYGAFEGTQVDSRRGQTFVLEMVDGSWRVSERTWETF